MVLTCSFKVALNAICTEFILFCIWKIFNLEKPKKEAEMSHEKTKQISILHWKFDRYNSEFIDCFFSPSEFEVKSRLIFSNAEYFCVNSLICQLLVYFSVKRFRGCRILTIVK